MIKRNCVAIAITFVAGSVISAAAHAQAQELKFHHFTPSTSYVQTKLIEPWCEKLAKASNDRLKCRIYPSMQLGGTPAQLVDQARDGIADVIFTNVAYQPGPFGKSEVFTMPFVVRDPVGSSRAVWDYIQQYAIDEYQRTRPMLAFLGDHNALHFAKKVGPTLEDVKGRKVRAAGRWEGKTLASLGMLPVQLAAPQITESVSKGVIDGVLVPWSGYQLLKLGDITKFQLDPGPKQTYIGFPVLLVAMNQAKYDSLPPDLKKAVDSVSGREMSVWAAEVYAEAMEAGYKAGKEQQAVVSLLSDAEHARWVKASAGVKDEWIAEVSGKGADGKKLYEAAGALIKKYEK